MTVEADVVVREIQIAAGPEVVFAYLTEPDKLMRWQAAAVDVDPRPGGRYRLDVTPRAIAIGSYVEVDPPRRLVYTWGWEGSADIPPGSTTVEITLEGDENATILRLRHTGLPTETDRAQHTEGWDYYFGRLAIAATGGDPGPDDHWQQST